MSRPLLRLLPSFLVVLAILACSKEEKQGKALESGALNPPWDSPAFTPRELETVDFDQPDSLFFVFKVIAMIDSMTGDRKSWTLNENAVDTVTLAQMFDSAFVFPSSPVASIPYAYDDSYRDDTLYRHYYGNGLFTQDHPCAQTYVVADPFLHPARWLKAGLKQAEIINALGTPSFSHKGVLRYFRRMEAPAPAEGSDSVKARSEYDMHPTLEGMNFYFRSDSLFAAVLHKSQPCH
jgi:hypothetical protein